MGLSPEEYFQKRFGEQREEIPADIEIPRPPEFNVNAPIVMNKYMNPGPNSLNMWAAAERHAPVPAPFQDGDAQHRGTSIECNARPLAEMSLPQVAETNPYSQTSDAKEMYAPPPPSFFQEGQREYRAPLPASTPNPTRRRWDEMSRSEQIDYYFEKKESFIDYLDETFEVRFEQQLYDICNKWVDDYERCTGVGTLRKGFAKWSRIRGNMRIMMQCSHQYQRMYNCLGEQDNGENQANLRSQDKRITKNMFPL